MISGQGLSDAILLYCRPGFEKECASDITQQADLLGVHGYVRAIKDAGHIRFVASGGGDALRDHPLIESKRMRSSSFILSVAGSLFTQLKYVF